MGSRKRSMTPLAAVAFGLLAGAVGTLAMDTIRYLQHRQAGGTERPLEWEFPKVDGWEQAPDPGQVVKRLVEGFTQRPIPDRWATLASNVGHWAYGSAAGVGYGILAGSLRRPYPLYGLPFGALLCGLSYALLPQAGLYKQIWEYDHETLAKDLGGHLAYGVAAGAAFWFLTAPFRAD